MCLDACFKQKRRKGAQIDPPFHHCDSFFLDEQRVKQYETYVEDVKAKHGKGKGKERARDEGVEGIRVPDAALAECEKSFIAADEHRVKASRKFFDDTGLMALLCRHDRVLWVVNMKSAGEKQSYALVLLDEFFRHIPSSATVGVLYDISCQLHQSIVKVRCSLSIIGLKSFYIGTV